MRFIVMEDDDDIDDDERERRRRKNGRRRVVFVVGATGTGKTKLSIDLARRLKSSFSSASSSRKTDVVVVNMDAGDQRWLSSQAPLVITQAVFRNR